jgi:hypothetical protein
MHYVCCTGKAFRIVILYTKQKEHDAADIFAKVRLLHMS